MRGNRIVVTGASGMVGQALVQRLLHRDCEVYCLSRRPESLFRFGEAIKTIEGDITSPEVCAKVAAKADIIIHLAGLAHIRGQGPAFRAINVDGTRNLAQAAAQSSIRHFIFTSSMSVYGDAKLPFLEDSTPMPNNMYGKSKLAAEAHVRALANHGVRYTILRPSAIYGPKDRGNTLRLIKAMDKGWFVMVGSSFVRKSLTYVDNVVDAILASIDHPSAVNQVFNVSDSNPYSVGQLTESIALALDRRFRRIAIPRSVAYLAAACLEFGMQAVRLEPKISRRDIQVINQDAYCSIERLTKAIGYEPRVPLEEGLRRTIDWYRQAFGSRA